MSTGGGLPSRTSPAQQTNSESTAPEDQTVKHPEGGLSTGAKAGIGVGIGVGFLLLLGLAIWIWRLKRKNKRHTAPPQYAERASEPQWSPEPSSAQEEVYGKQYQAYKPPRQEMSAVPDRSELYAGQDLLSRR